MDQLGCNPVSNLLNVLIGYAFEEESIILQEFCMDQLW